MNHLAQLRAPVRRPADTAPDDRTERIRGRGDDKAVASFVLGLVGLLVFNVVLGPLALVLSGVALAQSTRRPGRALLGALLGAADLVIIGVIIATHHGVSWHPGL